MSRFHSRLLNENANVTDNGSVTFDSGVIYSHEEIEVLKGITPEDMIGIHRIRQSFEGDLVFCGSTPDISVNSHSFLERYKQHSKKPKCTVDKIDIVDDWE